MTQHLSQRNPFMLLLNPAVIVAAVENSARLAQLNRRLCRPLDRPAPAAASGACATRDEDEDEDPVPPAN